MMTRLTHADALLQSEMLETMTSQALQVTGEECAAVLDVASLMLRRMNAVPIRLKILLDRLLTTLNDDAVKAILHECGWTYEDYVRGYKLQVRRTLTRTCTYDAFTHTLCSKKHALTFPVITPAFLGPFYTVCTSGNINEYSAIVLMIRLKHWMTLLKTPTFVFVITLAFLSRFFIFLSYWKQECLLYKKLTKFTTSPYNCLSTLSNVKQHILR